MFFVAFACESIAVAACCRTVFFVKLVVSVAGDSFGAKNNIRLSYAASEKDIQNAIIKMKELLNEIK